MRILLPTHLPKSLRIVIIVCAFLVTAVIVALATWFIGHHNVAVLNPMGAIADQQRQLIITATLLMALVVIPVFVMTFSIAWRYRASNHKARYAPDLAGNKWAEAAWWLIPLAIITVLATIVVVTSHSLDPSRPLASAKEPIRVEVVSLQWKWLFLYPDLHVASVNYLPIPTDTPINFVMTSDAPMNSFWVPQLGGQIYTMSGMSTQLHLIASQPGDYRGSSANISGDGFADMKFVVHATSQTDFNAWINQAAHSPQELTYDAYNQLAKPSTSQQMSYAFPSAYNGLFDTIIMKYMSHP